MRPELQSEPNRKSKIVTLLFNRFHAIRECFDPGKLLNPGKAIPTLARCAEFNAMHVHNGELPFPELERF